MPPQRQFHWLAARPSANDFLSQINEQKNSPSVETERPFRLLAICKILKLFF
jgi:hypothetical protein